MLDQACLLVHDSALDDQPYHVRLKGMERIEHCTRRLTYQAGAAVLVVNEREGSSSWANVQRCDSWACAYCAPHKAAEERLRLRVGLAEAQRQGLYGLMVTLTLRHARGDVLKEQLDRLYKAKKDMLSGRFLADLRERFGLVGHNRYTEITFGRHGWHAHMHLLLFTAFEFSEAEASRLQAELEPRWLKMLAKVGADGLRGVALDVRPADDSISDYLAKYGHMPAAEKQAWGAANELANAPAKRAHKGSFTPFELLALAAGDPEARTGQFAEMLGINPEAVRWLAGDLWREYYEALKGRQMVAWGAGLLAMLRVDELLKELDEAEAQECRPALALPDYVGLRRDVELYCAVMAAGADLAAVVALLEGGGYEFTLIEPGAADVDL